MRSFGKFQALLQISMGFTTWQLYCTALIVGISQTAALNRGCHVYLAGRPSRWALAHISSYLFNHGFICTNPRGRVTRRQRINILCNFIDIKYSFITSFMTRLINLFTSDNSFNFCINSWQRMGGVHTKWWANFLEEVKATFCKLILKISWQ